ncbi:hypothetical protein V2W45_530002 [Cenococcum geophilum]
MTTRVKTNTQPGRGCCFPEAASAADHVFFRCICVLHFCEFIIARPHMLSLASNSRNMKPRILPHLLSYGVTTIFAEPLALYSPGNGQTNFVLAAALTGSEGCSALQKGSIQSGFYEMNDLFTAASVMSAVRLGYKNEAKTDPKFGFRLLTGYVTG